MTKNEIKAMQRKIRLFYKEADREGCDDGFWGRLSQSACRDYLRSLMPKENPWPKPDAANLRAFYGRPGDEAQLTMITLPFDMFYGGAKVTRTRVNKKCADSLLRVLNDIKTRHGDDERVMRAAEDYAGIFNFRNKRGGSSYSLHAYGAAIDLDADNNTFKQTWPLSATMPLEIMECFSREGWLSAGAFWGYDSMHFEAIK